MVMFKKLKLVDFIGIVSFLERSDGIIYKVGSKTRENNSKNVELMHRFDKCYDNLLLALLAELSDMEATS